VIDSADFSVFPLLVGRQEGHTASKPLGIVVSVCGLWAGRV